MKTAGSPPLKLFFSLWISMYVFLYVFPFPLNYIPFAYEWMASYFIRVLHSLNYFVGRNILGLESLNFDGGMGSGDTTFDYVFLVTRSLLSLASALILILLSRRFEWVKLLSPAMMITARYFVGITLIQYGVMKFMIGQFPGPSISSMEQAYGDFSPMGLAWRFFGYSDLYKAFMGVAEILAGSLLLFRRTVVLGAMLSIAVATNIVLVNFSFDVPVKLFSSHLLLFSFMTLSPYIKRLFDLFLLQKPTQLTVEPLTFSSAGKKWAYRVVKCYMAIVLPLSFIATHISNQKFKRFDNPWEGSYEVLTFEKDKEDFPMDAEWVKVILDTRSIAVERVSGRKTYFTIKEIVEGNLIILSSSENMESDDTLRFSEDGSTCHLVATIGTHQFDMTAKRKKKSDYFLINRGFNWINEHPLNR